MELVSIIDQDDYVELSTRWKKSEKMSVFSETAPVCFTYSAGDSAPHWTTNGA